MMTTPGIDLTERAARWHTHGAERVAHHVGRFVALVRSLDAEQLDANVPGLDWTATDVVAHVATVWRRYTVDPSRAATWDGVAAANAADLAAIDHDVEVLLADIEANTQLMALAPDAIAPDELRPFHAGQYLTLAGAWGNAIDELLVHGDDIARAAGAEWTVDADDLEPFWRYTSRVLPGFMSAAGHAASDRWTLDLGFDTGPVHLRFDHGSVHVDEPGAWTPDQVIEADALEFTLAVPWRRRSLSAPGVADLLARFEAF